MSDPKNQKNLPVLNQTVNPTVNRARGRSETYALENPGKDPYYDPGFVVRGITENLQGKPSATDARGLEYKVLVEKRAKGEIPYDAYIAGIDAINKKYEALDKSAPLRSQQSQNELREAQDYMTPKEQKEQEFKNELAITDKTEAGANKRTEITEAGADRRNQQTNETNIKMNQNDNNTLRETTAMNNATSIKTTEMTEAGANARNKYTQDAETTRTGMQIQGNITVEELKGKNALDLQDKVNTGAINLENVKGQNLIKNTQVQGQEQRLTDAQNNAAEFAKTNMSKSWDAKIQEGVNQSENFKSILKLRETKINSVANRVSAIAQGVGGLRLRG